MIKLSHLELNQLASKFYDTIKDNVNSKIDDKIDYLNRFQTSNRINLGTYLKENLEFLITGKLDQIKEQFEADLKPLFDDNYINTKKSKRPNKFKKTINEILFFEKHNKWKAYNLCKDLGIKSCPYCNRTYITTLGDDNNKFVRPDIDHFLLKSEHPYLRMSFFNLIPSCIICNRNAKGDTEMNIYTHIYPYEEGFDNKTRFTYSSNNYHDLIGEGNANIDFVHLGDDTHNEKAKANIALFRLKEQYSIHHEELNHLIQLKKYHTESYLSDLKSKYGGLFNDDKEIYKLAFGKEYDLAKDSDQPLSKFTRDILHELGMLNILKE